MRVLRNRFWNRSHWRDLNPRPADYESAALPTELQWRRGSMHRFRAITVLEIGLASTRIERFRHVSHQVLRILDAE